MLTVHKYIPSQGYRHKILLYVAAYALLTIFVLAFPSTATAAKPQEQMDIPVCPPNIEYGEIIVCSIDSPAEIDQYAFTASAGDQIQVRMTVTGEMLPGVEVRKDGETISGCTDSGNPTAIIDSCLLPENGRYHVFAYDWPSLNRTGQYHLSLTNLSDPANSRPIRFGQIVTDSITLPTQTNIYSFSAKKGVPIQVIMTHDGGIVSGVEVRKDGEIVPKCIDSGNPTANIDNCLLSDGGSYHILTYDWPSHYRTGSFTLSLNCLIESCEEEARNSSLVLIYAVLDNNLGDDPETWERLVNNAELGKHDEVNVRLFVDGPGNNDAYVYDIQQDDNPACPSLNNPTCGSVYTEGQNFWKTEYEDAAHPQTLYNFVEEALTTYTNVPTITLSLVGHGAGWTASALPGQPSKWGSQPGDPPDPADHEERIGGLLWDDTPNTGDNTSRSMSTKALGVAMNWISDEIGAPINLLYLDACSMGITEVAYEIRNSVEYLLASPNTAWASFAYDDMLQATNGGQDGQQIGTAWLSAEAMALEGGAYPFTLSLIDLGKMADLTAPSSTFADLLQSADGEKVGQAFVAADHYESDYNGVLENVDNYVDMSSFATQIKAVLGGDGAMGNAAQALANTVQNAVVKEFSYENGEPWPFPEEEWTWNDPGGLSVYLPLAEDEAKRALYMGANLQWAADTTWDEFLAAFWGVNAAALDAYADELPTCPSTRNCEPLAEQLELNVFSIYLPTVQNQP